MRPAETVAVVTAAVLWAAGCGRPAGPPAIASGTPCASCGMEVADLRFACEERTRAGWRVYDSIECLIRDARGGTAEAIYLADYDRRSLVAAESLWVVRGEFASPMGGGFAAFIDRAAADSIAAQTRGRVDHLSAFMANPGEAAR